MANIPDPFIISLPRNNTKSGRQFLAVSPETHKKLSDLQDRTGYSVGKLAGMAIDYALDRLEVVEE